MEIEGKNAVVTGAASGIGLAIAKALLEKGAGVMLADIDEAGVVKAAQALGEHAHAAYVDVASLASVEALADKAWAEFGHVDMIFNNAGITSGRRSTLWKASPEEIARVLDVNLKGVWHGIAVFVKRFVEQGTPAAVCNTGSEHSLGFAHPLAGIYTATKHGVLALSDVLRYEAPDFIEVSVFCPGAVNTNITPGDFGMEADGVGRHVVESVARGDFIIVTHPHVVKLAEKRWQEISAAFAAQAPYTPESEKYNVLTLMEKAREKQKKGEK